MEHEQFSQMKQDYAVLMGLCKSGADRGTAVSDDKLKKSLDPQSFCVVCAANMPEIDFSLKLFSLQGWFSEHAPQAPRPGDEAAARAFLDACIAALSAQVSQRIRSGEIDPEAIARDAVLDCGTQFSGKLIHSDVSGMALFAPAAQTSQPHVSSRSLRQSGFELPLDQSKLDNKGVFQRVVKVLNQDPLSVQARIPSEAIDAIKSGVKSALTQAAQQRPTTVDHRLRQILLPTGDDYLAVSPLAAGGLSVLLHQAAAAVEGDREQQDEMQQSVSPTGETTKTQDAQPAPKSAPRFFERIAFPVGGSIVRNTSMHPARAVQNALYFHVPQRQVDLRAAWSFVSIPVRLWISQDEIDQFSAQHARLQESASIGQSSGVLAVRVQASGALAAITRRLHHRMKDLAAIVSEASYPVDGADVPIDEDLLRAKRSKPPATLDLCIVRGSFGAEYRAAMAQAITQILFDRAKDKKTHIPLLGEVDRQRMHHAVEIILESSN